MARAPRAKRTKAADGVVSVTGKAANGEGSIYFVPSKGTYRAAWVDAATGKAPFGQRTNQGRSGPAHGRR